MLRKLDQPHSRSKEYAAFSKRRLRAKLRAQRPEVMERARQAVRKHWRIHGRFRRRGIEREDYLRLLEDQGGKCKTCPRTPEESRGGLLCIDHDHKTGKVRALLCHNCNVALGLIGERVETLRALIALVLYEQEGK